jgi:flagellar basal body-associated protein FliL
MKTLLTLAFVVMMTLSGFSQDTQIRKEPKPTTYYALYNPSEHNELNLNHFNCNRDIMISIMRLEKVSKLLEKEIKYDADKFEALSNLDELMKEQEQKIKYVAPCID